MAAALEKIITQLRARQQIGESSQQQLHEFVAALLPADTNERLELLAGLSGESLAVATGALAAAGQHQAPSAGPVSVPVRVTICIKPLWKGDSPEIFTTTFKSEADFQEYLRQAQVPGLFFVPIVSSSSSSSSVPVASSSSSTVPVASSSSSVPVASSSSSSSSVPVASSSVEEEEEEEDEDKRVERVLIRDFSQLVDGGFYSHTPAIKEAQKRILGELRHLQQSREDEMAAALLTYLQRQEPQEEYRLRNDLREKLVCKDGKVHEQDIVIVGNSKGVLGSHKTHVKGAKPVKEIVGRAGELGELSQSPQMKGTPNAELPRDMRAAFMAEKVEPGKEASLQKACKNLKVMRLQRNGNASQVFNRMGRAASLRHSFV